MAVICGVSVWKLVFGCWGPGGVSSLPGPKQRTIAIYLQSFDWFEFHLQSPIHWMVLSIMRNDLIHENGWSEFVLHFQGESKIKRFMGRNRFSWDWFHWHLSCIVSTMEKTIYGTEITVKTRYFQKSILWENPRQASYSYEIQPGL